MVHKIIWVQAIQLQWWPWLQMMSTYDQWWRSIAKNALTLEVTHGGGSSLGHMMTSTTMTVVAAAMVAVLGRMIGLLQCWWRHNNDEMSFIGLVWIGLNVFEKTEMKKRKTWTWRDPRENKSVSSGQDIGKSCHPNRGRRSKMNLKKILLCWTFKISSFKSLDAWKTKEWDFLLV